MTKEEQFQLLHPDIIQSFLATGKSDAIPVDLQRYILLLDKVPELQRRYPSVSTCARKMMALYPSDNLSFHTARQIIYDAINYFHLNSTVKNTAWNNLYADRAEELHYICVAQGDLKTAGAYLEKAKEWRHNPNEDVINPNLLKPNVFVLSPVVTWKMLTGKDEEPSLKVIAGERFKQFKEACKMIDSYPINSEQKVNLKKEAALTLNIEDVEVIDEN